MTIREQSLTAAKIAGYHNDKRTFTRLVIECRVNRQAMNQAWNYGQAAKKNGIKCNCYECKKERTCPTCNVDRSETIAGNALRCLNCGSEWNKVLCPPITETTSAV